MRKLITTAIVAGILAAGPASSLATTLYDNGPINGTVDAWTINSGFTVADSFSLAGASTVTEVHFGVWNFPGDVITSVGWSITSAPNGGTSFGSGTAAVSSSFQYVNGFGYNINQDSFLLSSLLLPAGTYFLNLQNAAVANGDPAYWDENDGSSVAWESALGYLAPVGNCESGQATGPYCSESFQILGTVGQVPEPAPILLLGAGLAAIALARRRQKSV